MSHKKEIILITLLFLAWLILPQTSQAATYYLDIDGVGEDGILDTADDVSSSDANPGTSELPWKTLARAYDSNTLTPNVEPGDTVYLRNGNYGKYTESLTANRSNWITYKAATGHTPVFTQINITSSVKRDAYLKFDGINIQHPNYTPTPDGYWHYDDANAPGLLAYIWNANYVQLLNGNYKGCNKYISEGIQISGSSNILIQRCEIHTFYSGMEVTDCTDSSIKNCYIHEMSDATAVRILTGCSNILIENNHIYDQREDVNDTYYPYNEPPEDVHPGSGIGLRSPHITIRKNIVHGGFVQGIMFYSDVGTRFHEMIVENNLFYNTGKNWLIEIGGVATIRNNTFIGRIYNTSIDLWGYIIARYSGQSFAIDFATGFDGSGVDIYNNICVDYGWQWQLLVTDPDLLFNEGHNILWGRVDRTNTTKSADSSVIVWSVNDNNHGWPNYFEDIGYRDSTPEYNYATDGIQPFFVNPGLYFGVIGNYKDSGKIWDYHLAPGSPGINFGDPNNQPSDSLGSLDTDNKFILDDGPARDATHHSAGAYEYISSTPLPSILYGDISGDNAVDISDALMAAQSSVGLRTLDSDQTKKGDVNEDGKVSAYDAALILQKIAGLIPKFPVE